MKTYKVNIREVSERIVEVEAETEEDAVDKVEQLWQDSEIVIDYTDFVDVSFDIWG